TASSCVLASLLAHAGQGKSDAIDPTTGSTRATIGEMLVGALAARPFGTIVKRQLRCVTAQETRVAEPRDRITSHIAHDNANGVPRFFGMRRSTRIVIFSAPWHRRHMRSLQWNTRAPSRARSQRSTAR